MPATQTALSRPKPTRNRSRARSRRLILFAPLTLLAIGGAMLGARARMPDNQIAPGVHIGSQDLGGKSLDAARTALEQWAAERGKTPVTLHFAPETGIERVWKTSAQYMGLGIDVPATLDAAGKAGREDVMSQVANLIHGGHTVEIVPVPTIDNGKLLPVLKQIAGTVLRRPVNARIVLLKGGGFGTHHDKPGRVMDVDASAQAVTLAWTNALGAPHAAPVAGSPPPAPTSAPPSPTAPAADPNAHQKPDPTAHTDAPATDHPSTLPANPQPQAAQNHVGAPGAGKSAESIQNPKSKIQNPEIASQVDVELVAHSTQAEITFADIQQIDGLLGSKTTTYATGDRGDNIHLAASRINGTLLRPGEVFSYNRVVGPRSSSEGFKDAPVIIKGELKPGIGGGICQTSSTLYNAVLLSGLKIVHRAHHAFPVHYLPAGRDATVVDGDIDFQFQNSTATPIYVVGRGRGGVLTFSIYGKRIPGREIVMEKGRDIIGAYPTRLEEDPTLRAGHREVKRRGFPDRRVTWYRVVRQNGQEVSRETINTHYSAIDEIVAVGTRQSAPRRRTAPKPAPTHITPPAVPPATPPATTPQGQQ